MNTPKALFVTGATNGTGYAIASRFAREGYDIFLTSRNRQAAAEAAARIASKYHVYTKGYELPTKPYSAVANVFEDIRAQGRLINTVVCNAANLGIGMNPLTTSPDDFMSVFETNLGWNYAIAQQGALHMKKLGGGAIVFITSNTAYRAIPDRCAYSASKSGLLGLSRALAVDLGPYGIRSNCVLPGMIKTTRWQENPALQRVPSNYTPIGDIAEFTDIANAAYYLGSDQARNTTGAELVVDGGNSIQLYPQIP